MLEMAESLHVCFNSPQSGWMSFELSAGEQKFVEVVSYTPYDSVRDLVNAVATILVADTDEAVVRWGINPESLDFKFRSRGDEADLKVFRYLDHRRVLGEGELEFSFRGDRVELCRSFWKSLRALQGAAETDEFARNWRREFPARELGELTKSLRRVARRRRREGSEASPRRPRAA
jgi:hypothetical protein